MMKQLSILIENKPGTMAEVTKVLAEEGVSIKAFSMNDTSDFGILRIIVDNIEIGQKALSSHGFGFTVTDVVAVELQDETGALNSLLDTLHEENYNVNYIYSMVLRKVGLPLIILQIQPDDGVEDYLKSKGFIVYDMEQN